MIKDMNPLKYHVTPYMREIVRLAMSHTQIKDWILSVCDPPDWWDVGKSIAPATTDPAFKKMIAFYDWTQPTFQEGIYLNTVFAGYYTWMKEAIGVAFLKAKIEHARYSLQILGLSLQKNVPLVSFDGFIFTQRTEKKEKLYYYKARWSHLGELKEARRYFDNAKVTVNRDIFDLTRTPSKLCTVPVLSKADPSKFPNLGEVRFESTAWLQRVGSWEEGNYVDYAGRTYNRHSLHRSGKSADGEFVLNLLKDHEGLKRATEWASWRESVIQQREQEKLERSLPELQRAYSDKLWER